MRFYSNHKYFLKICKSNLRGKKSWGLYHNDWREGSEGREMWNYILILKNRKKAVKLKLIIAVISYNSETLSFLYESVT